MVTGRAWDGSLGCELPGFRRLQPPELPKSLPGAGLHHSDLGNAETRRLGKPGGERKTDRQGQKGMRNRSFERNRSTSKHNTDGVSESAFDGPLSALESRFGSI